MYDTTVLTSLAQTLIDRQDDPAQLLADLRDVKQHHEDIGTAEELQRFELKLELDADDFGTVLNEVEREIEGEDDR